MVDPSSGILSEFVRSLAASSPYLLVLGIGLLMAVIRARLHPLVSLLAGAGFSLHALTIVGSSLAYAWLAHGLGHTAEWSNVNWHWWYFGLHVVTSLLHALGAGLILMAVFGWRLGPDAEPR